MKAMKRVSSSNALKSMRRVSSGSALKDMAEVATSLRNIANTNVEKLKKKQAKSVKGIMTRVGMKKVAKSSKTKDTDGTSVGSQKSPVSVNEGEDVEYENVTIYDIEVDDETIEAKGFDPPETSSVQKESEQVDKKSEEKNISPPAEALEEKGAQGMDVAPAPESSSVTEKKETIVAPTIPAENLVEVVLLLTDATSRRFELVQLDLDSNKARVRDLLTKIPIVSTEESLRKKKYVAICSRKGAKMDNSKLVTEYFRHGGNHTASNFALAMPEGMSAKECARVASPILSDNKILSMLNIREETETEADTPTAAPVSPSPSSNAGSTDAEVVLETETDTKQSKSNAKSAFISTFSILLIAVFSVSVKFYNDYISFPLGPGDILHAGEKRHKCGLLRFLPEEHTGCHSLTLENDGTGSLGLYDGEELLWQMYVPTCDEGCAVTLNDDGKVLIGDREGFFSSRPPANVSPWPFSQNVKNGYKKKKL